MHWQQHFDDHNDQALTRCQKVKSRREREIWNQYLEFREEKREMSRSVFWFEKRTRIFAKNNREICNFLQFREEKEKFWKQISWFERRSRRRDFKLFFLFSKLEKIADFSIFLGKNSLSLLEPENRSRHFSFLFSKFEIWIPYFSFSSRFHFLASRQCLIQFVLTMSNLDEHPVPVN